MNSWHSYPSIYALGHKAVEGLLDGEVLVQEKVDGSQFSFGRFGDELRVRSKGKEMVVDAPEKMFSGAVETAKAKFDLLRDGWTYRGEVLSKPKHNALAYDRVPIGNVILFDVNVGEEDYLGYEDVQAEAQRLGLECVPLLFVGRVYSISQVHSFLQNVSVLGGQKIEGVVIKPLGYHILGHDKKVLMGKYVSEEYKEVHKESWKKSNPNQGDVVDGLVERYKTTARWRKGIIHLAELGEIDGSPKDIGPLMRAVVEDVKKECEEEIKEELFRWAWPQIGRRITAGIPDWYKKELLERQFDNGD